MKRVTVEVIVAEVNMLVDNPENMALLIINAINVYPIFCFIINVPLFAPAFTDS